MDLSPLDRALQAARRGHHEAARRLLDGVLASDGANEEALLWRARVAEDDAERASFLQRVVALNPDNRWAVDELAKIQDGGTAAAQPTSDTLSCPNCGGSVEVHPERGTKAAVCTYCGSVLELTAGQADIIGQMNPKVGPSQPVHPGDEATFFGENHLVMGWMQYEGWDDEDRWRWDEWQLVSDSGVPRYLSFSSDEGWMIQTPIRPTPKIGMMWIDTPDGKAFIKERGPARILAMRGEFTWRPGLDRTLQVIEAKTGKTHVSAETTADELEVVAGPRIEERELWEAFGREDKLKEMDERIEKRKRQRRALRLAALICFLASGVYFMGIGWAAAKGGTVISSSTADFVSDLSDLQRLPPLEGNNIIVRDSVVLTTVDVENPGDVYEIQVEAPYEGDIFASEVTIYVEEPDGDVHQLMGQLYNQNNTMAQATQAVRPDQRGPHTVIAFVDEGAPDRITFSTTVRTGMWDPGPFAMACGLTFLLGLVLLLGGGFGRIK